MSKRSLSLQFAENRIQKFLAATPVNELSGGNGEPFLSLVQVDDPGVSAGYLRIWVAESSQTLDRVIHFRLIGAPIETQLVFVIGKDDSILPHCHLQIVQFSHEGCVFNIGYLPRLDAIEHPGYFAKVFSPLTQHYLKATTDERNTCSKALTNPTVYLYLSPWQIASQRTDFAELERVTPSIDAYIEHYLQLIAGIDYPSPPAAVLKARNQSHMALFLDDPQDSRAWNGVYRVVGEETGRRIKDLLEINASDLKHL